MDPLREGASAVRTAMAGVGPGRLKSPLRAENRLLDLYGVTAQADPEHRVLLDRQRATLVRLGNRTQDWIDGPGG
jgi:hypothetical protein